MTPTRYPLGRLAGMMIASALFVSAVAQTTLAPAPVPLTSLAEFKNPTANWQLAADLTGDPRTEKTLAVLPGTGVLVNQPTPAVRGNLVTAWQHGDLALELDFLLPPGSNSGLYLMGRYEVQLFDSWGKATPTFADCGGIYERWDDARGAGHQGYEGIAPRANASRAPGLWQHLQVVFRAPRFDAAGKKIANARFLKVVLNGFTIHENVEVNGPTRSALFPDEAPLGPLMIQGDHGALALRHLTVKRYDATAAPVKVENLAYQLYGPAKDRKAGFDPQPKAEGQLAELSLREFEKAGRFNLIVKGTVVVPADGDYAFSADGGRPYRLDLDEQPAIVDGGETVPLRLKAGPHPFRLEYFHHGWGPPQFRLAVEGPGLAPSFLSVQAPRPDAGNRAARPRELLITPEDGRVRIQRGFVPFEPKKRLYAINVGTPAGVSFAYDTETSALLRVWRGGFLDTFEMWDGRGENQLGKPVGPALTLPNLPVLALLERFAGDWPDQPDAMFTFKGYKLEPDGLPVFNSTLSSLTATDRLAPTADGRGLTRTTVVKGRPVSWEAWVLLADADQITPQPGGRGYIIGDREYYLDVPADAAVHPVLRTRHGRQQLVVPVNGRTLGQPIVTTLVW